MTSNIIWLVLHTIISVFCFMIVISTTEEFTRYMGTIIFSGNVILACVRANNINRDINDNQN